MRNKIAFIGVGNMSNAIIYGITTRKVDPIPYHQLVLCNRNLLKIQHFENLGAYITNSVTDAVNMADYIFLAVKPQNFPEILNEISHVNNVDSKVFISIAAGIKTGTISKIIASDKIIRALPNTPMTVGMGVSAICRKNEVSDNDYDFVTNLFAASGKVIKITEDEMNRIICVTSSSPAYVFKFIEAMLDGASIQGLTQANGGNISQKNILNAICDTIIGSCELMKASSCSPHELISQVASKGGTTEQALLELDTYKFSDGIISAMQKCTNRANELGDAENTYESTGKTN